MSVLKTAEEATGFPKSQVDEIRRAMPSSPLTGVLAYDFDIAIYHRRMSSAPKTQNDFDFERGVIEGLTIARGILNRK